MYSFEEDLNQRGYQRIIGVDEVGRGPYAGPVVAAAVILPPDAKSSIPGLNDSKKLTEKKRNELNEILLNRKDVLVSIVELSHSEVDRLNILEATHTAMRQAVDELKEQGGDFVLVDGNPVKGLSLPAQNVVKGDSKSASIAAASIVAKVYRDQLMCGYDKIYPGYGFAQHKGYGTKVHRDALEKLGVCEIHRRSFTPIAKILGIYTEKPTKKKSKKITDDSQPLLF